MATNNTIKVKIEATLPLPETQPQAKSPCSAGCGGTCGKIENPLLQHAGETLLNLAGGAYTLEQLSTALEIIEALLKRHYSVQRTE